MSKKYPFPSRPPSNFIINHACNRFFFKKLLLKKLTSALTTLNLILLLALMNYRLNLLSYSKVYYISSSCYPV